MAKIYIVYCLINPRTNTPYYVGVTMNRLQARLSLHMCQQGRSLGNTTVCDRRKDLHNTFRHDGIKPVIKALAVADIHTVDFLEHHYYNHFINIGHELLQLGTRFNYSKHILNRRSF